MKIGFGFQAGEDVDLTVSQGGQSASARVERYGQAHIARTAKAGRVNVLPLDISETPEGGVRPRQGGGTTLDLRELKAGGNFVAALDDGRKLMVETSVRQQKDGFGAGEHYWLPFHPVTNRVVVEPGRNHLTLHFSGRPGALTRAAVASEAGVAATAVTLTWLRANPQYGSQARPLEWNSFKHEFGFARGQPGGHSLWLLFERGYTYSGISSPNFRAAKGQSQLHPLVFGAWGVGDDAVYQMGEPYYDHPGKQNILFQGVRISGHMPIHGGRNFLFDGVRFDKEITFQVATRRVTLRDFRSFDIHRDAPVGANSATKWHAYDNRCSCIFTEGVRGLLFDGGAFDVGGYELGYDYNQAITHPHPPSMFSHCAYISATNRDVMARDTIFSRGASKGFDLRPGGYAVDCLMIDNEVPVPCLGGNYMNAGPVGEYTVLLGNVVTVAGHKRIAGGPDYISGAGAYNWGIEALGRDGVLIDNICAHRSDPNDPADQAKRPDAASNYRNNGSAPLFDNTLEYRWSNTGSIQGDQRIAGLVPATLSQTTIQKFTDQALATTGSDLDDFYAYMRAQRPADVVRDVLTFFRQGFGIHAAPRTASTTVTFQPDWRGEGFRWDNRLNWTSGDVPGTAFADTVNLYGHDVKFGNHVAQLASLVSNGGVLDVVSGKLTVDAASDALTATVRECGQLWLGAVAEGTKLTALGGRVAFTAAATGHDLTVAGDQTEVLLGENHTIAAGKVLDLRSHRSLVGWDGTGNAALALNGTLRVAAGVTIETDFMHVDMVQGSTLRGRTSGFTGVVDWVEVVGRYPERCHIHLRDVIGTPVAGEVCEGAPIIRSTADNGRFDPALHDQDAPEWNPATIPTGTINSIASVAMPRIAPFVSGIHGAAAPTVTPTVTLSGPLELNLNGMTAGTHPLIQAPITGTFSEVTATGLAANLDATVTVAPDGVTLTLAEGTGQVGLVTIPPAPTLPGVSVTGGQITSFNREGVDYVEIRFDQSGSFTVAEALPWHRRAMGAGGGTGGRSERDAVMPGAGGAGGFAQVLDAPLAAGSYVVTIGAGAPGYASGVIGQANGGNSQLTGPGINQTLTGGGSGGSYKTGANFEIGTLTGLPGGSGGGGRATSGGGMAGGAGISGQGYQGGAGNGSAVSSGGGSGGAGSAGGNGGSAPSSGGPGGAGAVLDWIATPRTVCAGERGLVAADRGASSAARNYGSGSRGAVHGAVGKGGDGFLFLVLRADQAHVIAA